MHANYKSCEYCGEPIVGGNRNKRFCNPSCRSLHHYYEKKAQNPVRSSIVRTIDHNFDVLVQNVGKKHQAELEFEEMLKQGFRPKYCSHHFYVGDVEWFGLYEFAFRVVNRKIIVQHNQSAIQEMLK